MSEKTKHHFVPKFYLKQFVRSEFISLYHIKEDKYIFDIPSEDQAQKKRLYGDNSELENAFADLETEVAPILKQIVTMLQVPSKANMKYFSLLNFVILQNLRTSKSIEQTDQGIEQMLKMYLEDVPEFSDINLEDYKIRMKNAFALNTGIAIPIAIESFDLEPILIINDTKYPFITCDNPCIKYNQFAEHIRWYNDGRGFGTMGIQIFLPITEKVMLALYDKDIYKTNSKGKRKTVVKAIENDVLNLNKLQFICADECLYFRRSKNIKRMIAQIKQEQALRNSFTPTAKKFKGSDGYLLVHSEPQLKVMLKLSFFQIKKNFQKFEIRGLSMDGLRRKSFNDFFITTYEQALQKYDPKDVTNKLLEILFEKQKKYGN